MRTIYLLLGTNMGSRSALLQQATHLIQQKIGEIAQTSSIYETEAWGKVEQADYLNQVLEVETLLSPHALLQQTQKIESLLGRERKEIWGPRTMDIDILFYENQSCSSDTLTLPHPHIPKRRFVLTPLSEIAPHFMHPILNKSILQLLKDCEDPLEVKKYSVVSSI